MKAIDMPTLIKELRTRMRGRVAPVMLGVFVAIASIVVIAIVADANWNYSSELGKDTFNSISITEMTLIALIGPTLCCNVISLERERQTLDFLLVTHLSPWNILMGKYLGAAGYLILLWMAIIPITAVSFILGGVSWLDFILMQCFLILLILLCSAIGVYSSSRAPKSNIAATWSISIVVFTFFVHLGFVSAVVELPGFYAGMLRNSLSNAATEMPQYLFILLFLISAIGLSYIPSSVVLSIVTFFRKKPASLPLQIYLFAAITLIIFGGVIFTNYIATTPSANLKSVPSAILSLETSMQSLDKNSVRDILMVGNPVMTAVILVDPYHTYHSNVFDNKYILLSVALFLMLLYTFTILTLAYGNLLRLYPQFAEKEKRKKIKSDKKKKTQPVVEEAVIEES